MKTHVTESGIYRIIEHSPETPEEFRDLQRKRLMQASDYDQRLQEADDFLRRAVNDPALPDPVRARAREAAHCLEMALAAINAGDAKAAAAWGTQVGRMIEIVAISFTEPLVVSHNRHVAGLATTRSNRSKDSLRLRDRLCTEAAKLWRTNPAKSLRRVQEQLAELHQGEPGYSLRTIQKHTAGLERPA